ncbi:MAG: YbbR domain-containing protein [Neolewinella sp.]|jgi:YbbR domain-containing protein
MAETDRKVLAICLGAAFVFWLILNLSRNYTINRQVPIGYLVDSERVLVGRMPELLDATITGSGWNLLWETLRKNQLTLEVNVQNKENKRMTGTLLERELSRMLSSNEVTIALPGFESVPIFTAPKEGKRVPVVSKVAINFSEGHLALNPPDILPDSITISGATDALEKISEWPTESLVLSDLNKTEKRAVNLKVPPEGVTLSRVKVNFTLAVEAFIQQTITVPVSLENGPLGKSYEYTPKTVDLLVSIPQSAYGSVRGQDFKLVADLTGLTAGESGNSVPITVQRKPEVVKGVRFMPRVVEYYLVE